MTAAPAIDVDRAWARLEHLAALTQAGAPWTRRAFTSLFRQGRDYLSSEFAAAGLRVETDVAGNLIGRRAGLDAGLKPIASGSHSDTVVDGGRYDGILGVVAALEVVQALGESGIALRHPLEIIDFLSEEPSDYGVSCVGSRAIAGLLDADMLACRADSGETLAEGMVRMGYAPSRIAEVRRPPGSTAAFVELHIEQGPVLEERRLPIGVVTGIVGIRRVLLRIEGRPDHAGTTPMDVRRDALVGAARFIDRAHAVASGLSGNPHYVVATVGRIRVMPNAANAVPGLAELVLEVRSDDARTLEMFPAHLLDDLAPELKSLRLQASMTELSRSDPVACDPGIMRAIERAADGTGLDCMRMPSGAGHDAAYMAATGPVGMIFVPCLAGRSHCPEESITREQLEHGLRILSRSLLELDAVLDR